MQRLCSSATVPSRGSDLAAGVDLYAAEGTFIPAGEQAVVGTGLAMAIPYGAYGRIAPRSGLTVKYCIGIGAGVVDADYRGEVQVVMYNYGNKGYSVRVGDRIAQLILESCLIRDPVEVQSIGMSHRGRSGFGSTGAVASVLESDTTGLPQGAYAAVASVDKVLSDAMADFNEAERRIAVEDVAQQVSLAMALDKTARSLRPSSKLEGYGTVVEVGSSDTLLKEVASDYEDVRVYHSFPSSRFADPKWAAEMWDVSQSPGT